MEGRRPPPPASHPFPDAPDFNKFWGTPSSKGFFKFAVPFMAGWVGLLCINFYLTRNETHYLGIKRISSQEEFIEKYELMKKGGQLKSIGLPIELKIDRAFPVNKEPSPGQAMSFDDGIEFSPSYVHLREEIEPVKQDLEPSKQNKSS